MSRHTFSPAPQRTPSYIHGPHDGAAPHFSPEIIAEADEFLLDQIFADADDLTSIGISLREAARRSDRAEIRLRLGQLRDTLVHAIRSSNLISKAEPNQIAGSKA